MKNIEWRREHRLPLTKKLNYSAPTIWAFQGMNSCMDESTLPRKLACDPAQAIVEVTNVTVCQ